MARPILATLHTCVARAISSADPPNFHRTKRTSADPETVMVPKHPLSLRSHPHFCMKCHPSLPIDRARQVSERAAFHA